MSKQIFEKVGHFIVPGKDLIAKLTLQLEKGFIFYEKIYPSCSLRRKGSWNWGGGGGGGDKGVGGEVLKGGTTHIVVLFSITNYFLLNIL